MTRPVLLLLLTAACGRSSDAPAPTPATEPPPPRPAAETPAAKPPAPMPPAPVAEPRDWSAIPLVAAESKTPRRAFTIRAPEGFELQVATYPMWRAPGAGPSRKAQVTVLDSIFPRSLDELTIPKNDVVSRRKLDNGMMVLATKSDPERRASVLVAIAIDTRDAFKCLATAHDGTDLTKTLAWLESICTSVVAKP